MEDKKKLATEQSDSLDNFIQLIRANLKSIIKVAPITIGFSLFLIYFCEYQFFPSFDLFSLGSLLVSASVLGLAVFLAITLGTCIPGLLWADVFFKDKEVRDELGYFLPKDEKNERLANTTFIRSYFLWPTTLCSCTIIYVLFSDNDYASYFIALPLLACLVLALELSSRYKLSGTSLVKFILASTMAYTLATIISLAVGIFSVETHLPEGSDFSQIMLLILIALTMNIVFATCAISLQNLKNSQTIFFSTLFSLLLSLGNNLWGILPEGIARILGVGNYIAQEIHVSGNPCEIKTIPWKQGENGLCTLENTKIIWSLGDTYRIRISISEKLIDVSIPTGDVISVIKSAERDKKSATRDQS